MVPNTRREFLADWTALVLDGSPPVPPGKIRYPVAFGA